MAAYTELFRQFESALNAYLYRLTANREEAEDLCQDAFIKGFENISSFSGKAQLKTWVFAIATNLAKDRLRRRRRWTVDAQERCRDKTLASVEIQQRMMAINQSSPQGQYEIKEHIDMCFTCMAKTLPLDHQLALILKDVYGFTLKDIALIVERGQGAVKHAVRDARRTMVDIFDQHCSLVSKKGVCHQCTELNGIFNPRQAAQQQKLALSESTASREHLYSLRAQLVRAIDPLRAEGTDLHDYLLSLIAVPD